MAILSESTKQMIKATAPVLKEHGVAITSRMYEILFERYPETKSLFGQAPEDQPKILASAVSAYAIHIDQLDKLSDAVGRMAAAHVRTQVKPEHYPMVGESLLQAMRDVLGEAATPEVLDAWGAAYFFLADILIDTESKMYASAS